jgi:hypothetical protein
VVGLGDRRASLRAIRDMLAVEADDTKWSRHKRECHCVCGMSDARVRVAIAKQLCAVMAELDALPGGEEETDLDRNGAAVADELAAARARRESGTAAS